MKITTRSNTAAGVAALAVVWACLHGAFGGERMPDAIAEHFYTPELIKQTYQAIGLTEEQQATLKEAAEKAQSRVTELQQEARDAGDKLAALVKREKLDAEAVLAQADKVMKLETDVKRTQLGLLIKIKNTLTAEQQAKLKELKGRQASMQSKLREAMELAQKWKGEGRDLSELELARDELQSLMREGNFKEAEELLDKTLRKLREPGK